LLGLEVQPTLKAADTCQVLRVLLPQARKLVHGHIQGVVVLILLERPYGVQALPLQFGRAQDLPV
jgi:hypothetical protein